MKFSAAPGEVVHAPFYANGSSIIQIDFGYLSGCVQVPDGEFTSVCIVQVLQPMDSFGIQLTDEFECSLFQQTSRFRCVSSQCISRFVTNAHLLANSFVKVPQHLLREKHCKFRNLCFNMISTLICTV